MHPTSLVSHCPGRGWKPSEALARVCRGGGAPLCRAEPRAARAPPVGCGPAAVEGVRNTGQAD